MHKLRTALALVAALGAGGLSASSASATASQTVICLNPGFVELLPPGEEVQDVSAIPGTQCEILTPSGPHVIH